MNRIQTVRTMLCSMLCGAGQVMFQQSVSCSLFFLIGIFWGAWSEGRMAVAWGAVVGLAVSTLTGHLLRLKPSEGEAGLWGFNGILLGCALMSFLRSTPLTWCVLMLGAASTVWLREGMNRVMRRWRLNSLTMPFVLICWLLLAAAHSFEGLSAEGLPTPALHQEGSIHLAMGPIHLIFYWLRGIAQVFLFDSWVTGLFFLAGLISANGWAAFWAAFSSALALALALLFQAPGTEISLGLYGFSPVLTGIALGAVFHRPSWRSALWAVLGVVLTLFAQGAANVILAPFGVPTLTVAFCLVSWIFLLPLFRSDSHSEKADHSDWHNKRPKKELFSN